MKLEPKGGPGFVNRQDVPSIGNPGGATEAQKAARERAIAAFMGAQTQQNQQQSAQNPSQVSPEEMVGIRQEQRANTPAPTPETETPQATETSGLSNIVEATSPPPAKVEEPLSPQYAVLARKEKALRAEYAKLKAERSAFQAEQQAAKGSTATAVEPAAVPDQSSFIPKDRLTQDFVSVLEELGITPEDAATRLLQHQPVDAATRAYIAKLEAKIAKVEAAQDEVKSTFDKQANDNYEQALVAIRNEAEDLVSTDPEFQTIREMGQTEEVVNLIKDVHAQGLPGKYRKGTLLTVEQAARLVEDELVNQWIEQSEKLSKLEKIQKRLNKPGTTPVAQQGNTQTQGTQQQQSAANQGTRTLTNSMSSTPKMSARERAIAVFEGKLKSS